MKNLREMRTEEVQAVVYKAIEDFNFGGYGLDDVEDLMGMDWHHALAAEITDVLLADE